MLSSFVNFFRCPDWLDDPCLTISIGSALLETLEAGGIKLSQRDANQDFSIGQCGELIDSLLLELYAQSDRSILTSSAIQKFYYSVRPMLGVKTRRLLQRLFLKDWNSRAFPSWPVDRTVDTINEQLLIAAMKKNGLDRVPIVWFWPKTYQSCVLITHDVETEKGLRFCSSLMDIDDEYGIKSSFQLVPEQRYEVTSEQIANFKQRGFEVNVHDLNHDGLLFSDQKTFLDRVKRINEYGRRFQAKGFRSGALYRNQTWFDSLEFEYDMSVPNVAHLEPQRGGCCTIFPYFVRKVLEVPVTLAQDYSLFNILSDFSTSLWEQQMTTIHLNHGMVHVITHPDYLADKRAEATYRNFLSRVCKLRERANSWVTLPSAVNEWWRQRSKLQLKSNDNDWEICGVGNDRASLCIVELHHNSLRYRLSPTGRCQSEPSSDGKSVSI